MILELFTNEFIEPFVTRCRKYRRRSIQRRKDTGVYIIRENGVIVYIGMSQSCVTEALYRHFYPYNDTHRNPRTYYDVTSDNRYTVYIIYSTAADAPKLERGLILGIKPRDNRERYQKYLDQLSVENIAAQVPQEIDEDLPF